MVLHNCIKKRQQRNKNQGVEVLPIKIKNKKQRAKLMCIFVTEFLPYGNNIEIGGTSHKVSITRCGKIMKEVKDSYKRIYFKNRYGHVKFHYPQLKENKLRSNGQL